MYLQAEWKQCGSLLMALDLHYFQVYIYSAGQRLNQKRTKILLSLNSPIIRCVKATKLQSIGRTISFRAAILFLMSWTLL